MPNLFVILQKLVPQHLLSRVVGRVAESGSLKKPFIRWFVTRYSVDMSDAQEQDPLAYENFNAFFTRALKAGARPLAEGINDALPVLCPADGAISQLGEITEHGLLQAKGRYYTVADLLASDHDAADFDGGSFATVYLSPKDYHRVHMPVAGKLTKMSYVPGDLYSVNQQTAEGVPNLFARNERLVCLFDTELGPMAIVLVGAMIVAGIETVWAGRVCPGRDRHEVQITQYDATVPAIELAAGAEIGRFYLGSTAIVLFGHAAVELNGKLAAESPVRMGQLLGLARPSALTD
ncbi:MAG: archaetidylserine decarboxylase [OM182 bacterium]|nr:archaetidylserine decarboxylase [Gammaproteobacteria bacterium]MDP4942564.1 archaetidylserine decarboxylase [OM182 bacterium]